VVAEAVPAPLGVDEPEQIAARRVVSCSPSSRTIWQDFERHREVAQRGASGQSASELRDEDELLELQAHGDRGPAELGEVVLVRAPDLLDEVVRPQALEHPRDLAG